MFLKFYKIVIFSLVVIFSATAYAKKFDAGTIQMLSPQTYANMPNKLQKEYLNKTRKELVTFEKKIPVTTKKNADLWQSLFIETAQAADQTCIICGTVLSTVNVGGRNVCPTTGRPCNDSGKPNFDGFRCSPIFGEVCVSRTPISSISERGLKEGNKKIVDKKEYERMVRSVAQFFDSTCSAKAPSNTHDGCRFLAKRMTEVTKELEIKIAELDKYNANPIPVRVSPKPTAETADADAAAETADEEVAATEEPTLPITSNADQARERRTAAANTGACTYDGGPGRKEQIVPDFDLLSGNTCVFDNNQRLLESLITNGCTNPRAMRKLISTQIKSSNGRVDGQTNTVNVFITKVELLEKKSETEATFNVRMVKYDLSKTPPKLQQITKKIKQKDGKFYWQGMFGVSREVSIGNTTRTIELAAIEGYATVIDARARMSEDCLLLEDINALQASGTSIVPSINPTGAPNTGAM